MGNKKLIEAARQLRRALADEFMKDATADRVRTALALIEEQLEELEQLAVQS